MCIREHDGEACTGGPSMHGEAPGDCRGHATVATEGGGGAPVMDGRCRTAEVASKARTGEPPAVPPANPDGALAATMRAGVGVARAECGAPGTSEPPIVAMQPKATDGPADRGNEAEPPDGAGDAAAAAAAAAPVAAADGTDAPVLGVGLAVPAPRALRGGQQASTMRVV
mmetsp:Transcript_108500/g.312566  ORF Transcript_108500/g.312566 Transcript_108500/m.312566 type:complete len:170 (+) Transcript_108500:621-1130(+)